MPTLTTLDLNVALGVRQIGAVSLSHRADGSPTLALKSCEAGFRVQEPAEDPSLFYEPFLRSFVLGIAMGVVTELIDVTAKV